MDPRYPGRGPADVGLAGTIERAARSPFFAAKLAQAGGAPTSWEQWRAIPPTTKEKLRALPDLDPITIVERREVVEFWRSGGVTGRPLFYPRTRADLEHARQAFRTGLEIAGVTADDTLICAFPLGIHPAGQWIARAAEEIGAAVLWAGAGNQLPSAVQVELIHDFGVTVWCGMASYGLHVAHVAEAAGRPLARAGVRRVVTSAEPLSPSKRAALQRLWGAEVRDTFGMSELSLLGAECERARGLHMWTESSFCEVLDPDTLEPVALGETGVLCTTSPAMSHAVPFLRWVSGDLVRIEHDCDCDAARHPRLIHSGRTSGFFKVRGVNVDHSEAEDRLYAIEALRDFRVRVTRDDRLVVELEPADGADDQAAAQVESAFFETFGVRPQAEIVKRGTIARAVGDQIKAQRFVDERA